MLARLRPAAKTESDQGFTLIELLVVMIIIGILAAIAIPVFLSQRQKAQDTATKADVSSIAKEIQTYYVDNTVNPQAAALAISGQSAATGAPGSYTFTPVAAGAATTLGRVSQVTIAIQNQKFTSSSSWCVALKNTSGSGGGIWKYSAVNGLQSGDCVSGTDY